MFKNNKKKFNNRGFYIEYSLIDPKLSYEYINEVSFIVRNIDRTPNNSNIFEWKNILDNKIKNLLYIYIHILTIPVKPWLDKNLYTSFDNGFDDYILTHKIVDQTYTFNSITYQVAFSNDYIIDFISNTNTFSYDIVYNKFYQYTRSTRSIMNEPFIYLNIDSNDNLSNNASYNTSKLTNNFSFKLIPIAYTDNYVYYKSLKQYIIKKISTVKSLDYLNITLSDSTNRKMINNNLNDYLINRPYTVCDCINNEVKASCYCTYIRHPLHPQSQIDIGFKIGQIQNELINNIFD